ncbi:MAG: hypothetical protein H0T93_13055 [Chloroflexia bacterium]|nr:hypothetical protein [Chloroflexia bacterium]
MSSYESPITRRSLLLGASLALTGAVVAGRGIPLAVAQEATPGAGLAEMGLPALDVTVTAAAYEGLPESLAAGRYLLTLTVGEDAGELGGSIEFVQPVGVTAEEYIAALAPPSEGAATPALAPEASPEAGGEAMDGPPTFFFESLFAGGVSAMPGESAQIVLDLTPGKWIGSSGGDPDQSQAPFIFEVTGEMPADLPEPASDATITMGEYVIEVTSGELAAGSQVVRVENIGAQPHFIVWFSGPDGLTDADVEAVLESDMTGTPAAVDFDPNVDLVPVLYTATQSTGTSVWTPVELEPGTYVLVCFFPDLADGMPHAFHGMYRIIENAA